MHEAERACMKSLARTYLQAILYKLLVAAAAVSAQYDGASVALITEERMADMPHMGTYLMGAAGLKDTLNQSDIAEALYHAVVGYGMLAYARVGREHRHTEPVLRIAADVALNAPFIFGEVAPHHGVVAAVCSLVEELCAELCLCVRRLGNDQKAACVLVYTVNEAHFWVVWGYTKAGRADAMLWH